MAPQCQLVCRFNLVSQFTFGYYVPIYRSVALLLLGNLLDQNYREIRERFCPLRVIQAKQMDRITYHRWTEDVARMMAAEEAHVH